MQTVVTTLPPATVPIAPIGSSARPPCATATLVVFSAVDGVLLDAGTRATSDTQAALTVDRALVAALLGPGQNFLEVHHARVGEEQGLVAGRDQRRAGHDLMTTLGKEIEEALSDLRGRHPRDRRAIARDRSALPAEGSFRHGLRVAKAALLACVASSGARRACRYRV